MQLGRGFVSFMALMLVTAPLRAENVDGAPPGDVGSAGNINSPDSIVPPPNEPAPPIAGAPNEVSRDTLPPPPADEDALPKKKKKKKRRLASVDEGARYTELRVRSRRPITSDGADLRIGALGGFSATGGTKTDSSYVNLLLTAQADFRIYRYFGLEADLYGDLLTGKYQGSGATSPTETKQSLGGMVNVKGQIPFSVGRVDVIPKAGVGYGFHNVERSSTPSSGTATLSTTATNGLYFLAGIDVEATARLIFYTDFAFSMGATSTLTTATSDTELTNGSFNRFRLGGYYRFAPHWGLGAQFTLRKTTSDNTPTNNAPTQFLGLLMYEL